MVENSSFNYIETCGQLLPCGRCKLTMQMCPDNSATIKIDWNAQELTTNVVAPEEANKTWIQSHYGSKY